MDLEAASTFHLALLRRQNYSEETLTRYGMVETRYLAFLSEQLALQPPPLAALNPEHVGRYIDYLRTEHRSPRRGGSEAGHSENSIAQDIVVLKAWGGFLARQKQFPGNPLETLAVPKIEQRLQPVVALAEAERMLAVAASGTLALRNTAILALLWETGLRASELCGLRLADVEAWTPERRGRIVVHGKGRKQRLAYYGRQAHGDLAAYLRRRAGVTELKGRGWAPATEDALPWLFVERTGDQLSRGALAKVTRMIGQRAGIAWRVTPHCWRRFFATEYLRQNPGQLEQLRILMGHASLRQTLEYARLVEQDVEASYRSLLDGRRNGRAR